MSRAALLIRDDKGLYCPAGDFHIDPWRPAARAIITHAHADHARPGCSAYLCAEPARLPLSLRLGSPIQTVQYGEQLTIGSAKVSLHPAGHVLGSAQIRVEVAGEVWVVSGDYKREADPTCDPFESVQCHTFITEATFGLPIYRWQPSEQVMEAIYSWWQANAEAGKTSILFSYVMGKTQRIMASLALYDGGMENHYAHGALQKMNQAYRDSSIYLPDAPNPLTMPANHDFSSALIFAPPSAQGTPWMRRFKKSVTARASGWMRVRGRRRRLALDRGFVLSDHADWPGLLNTIFESRAEHVIATHGSSQVLARYLQERGLNTDVMATGAWEQVESTQE